MENAIGKKRKENEMNNETKHEEEKFECERCHKKVDWETEIAEVPFHGYTMILCRKCTYKAYASNEAV